MKIQVKNSQAYILTLAWLIFFLTFIAYIPLPPGVNTGLDPSWRYAITRAAQEKLTFGQDIIFTYGPFGYLIHGSVLNGNFFSIFSFGFIVHVALFVITLVKSLEVKTVLYKILLYFSVVLSYQIGPSTDYEIIFAFIMLLSLDKIRESKSMQWWSLGLGTVAGFCLLTKFTVGICTVGSLVLILSSNIYNSFKSKSNIFFDITCFFNTVIAFISVAFLLVDYNFLSNFKVLLFCFLCASTLSILSRILLRKNKHLFIKGKIRYQHIITSQFYLTFILCLIINIFNHSPALFYFIKGSLAISSGYSSAMSIVGASSEVAFALSQILLITILFILLTKENPKKLGLYLSLEFILWLSFKHGFIRQDSHVFLFICATPLIIILCTNHIKTINTNRVALLTHSYAVFIFFIYSIIPHPLGQDRNINAFQALYPQNFSSKIFTLFHLNQLEKNIKASSLENLKKVKLPDEIKNRVAGKVIDIVPWELSLIEANNLNWKPRPIIQSYSAYTKFLDSKNYQSTVDFPRDNIFYNFYTIDGRHPYFDEPKTFFNIFCNYQFSTYINELETNEFIQNMILLEQRNSNICSSGKIVNKTSINWNQEKILEFNNADFIRAKVKIKYSLLGKIYKTIFRIPPIYIQVNYSDGNTSKYRIIAENSANGIIISHLPTTASEAISLFKGKLPFKVKSFSLITNNYFLYSPSIKVYFITYNLIGSSIQQLKWIDASKLQNVKFNADDYNRYLTSFDSNNENAFIQQKQREIINLENTVHFSGWAVDKTNMENSLWVLVTDTNTKKVIGINQAGNFRPDVAKHFQNKEYLTSGWIIRVPSEKLGEGTHDLKAWIYDPSKNYATAMNGTYHIEIKK